MKKLALLVVVVGFLTSSCAVGPYTRYVASKIEGQLLDSGRPVANARVTREIVVQHSGEKTIQRAVTDANGRFSLEEVTSLGFVESIATWVYHFEIRAEIGDKSVTVWKGWKTDNFRFGDFRHASVFFEKRGDVLTFTCDVAGNPIVSGR
jgi:hypothetical protein